MQNSSSTVHTAQGRLYYRGKSLWREFVVTPLPIPCPPFDQAAQIGQKLVIARCIPLDASQKARKLVHGHGGSCRPGQAVLKASGTVLWCRRYSEHMCGIYKKSWHVLHITALQ